MQRAVASVLNSSLNIRESGRINDVGLQAVNYKALGRYVKLHQPRGEIVHVGYKTIS